LVISFVAPEMQATVLAAVPQRGQDALRLFLHGVARFL
jgi:hypothetical protein